MVNLTPDYSLLAIVVIFIATYFVVRRYLIAPINGILVAREAEIRDADHRYEESLAKFNEETSRMEAKIQEAKREASSIRERLRGEASTHRNEVVQTTREKAESRVREAEEQITREAEEGRERIGRESEALAYDAAEKILGRKVS